MDQADSQTQNVNVPVAEETKHDIPKRDSEARTASAAVFFNENKSIAGFGNSMRAVFTSVRELVENSLDAAEKRGVTPEIYVNVRKLDKSELNELMGTEVLRERDKRVDFIELTCKDNGIGVPRELIPQLFGTVLAGTKYGAQQTRGRFGLGSKMVLLYAMSTLDLPIEITTRPEGEDVTYKVKLFIDLENNKPIIKSDEQFEEGHEEYFDDYGTQIKVSFTGSWSLAKMYVREYFRQLAIITPYADMLVSLPSDDGDGNDVLEFKRVVDKIPDPPEVVKIHPWGTDISSFRREMTHATEDNLIDFLSNNFMGVTDNAAKAFFEEVDVDESKDPKDLTSQEIRRIVHDGFNRALKESKTVSRKRDRVFKFEEPKGDALSPLGQDRLRRGLEKELSPDFVEAVTRKPKAYAGHPFIVEAAIGYGGGVNNAAKSKSVTIVDNRIIYRYANRIPLIFGAGSDLITNVANSINWSDYGLTRRTEPLAIAVSLVSTKIPFPETSKEYIDKVEEIGREVRLTLMKLGRKLKTFLGRRKRRARERRRKSRFERYAPGTVENLLRILKKENIWDPATGVSAERIISALASGKPRIDSSLKPLRDPIYQAPVWSTLETQTALQMNGIHEVATFLRTPNEQLKDIMEKSVDYIDEVKRRTIKEMDMADQIPELDTEIILPSDQEIRFHRRTDKEKLVDLPRLYKACNRRWIRNVYDYLVSPNKQLRKVQGLATKLVEAERVNVIEHLFENEKKVDLADELSSLFEEEELFGDYESEISKYTQEDISEEKLEKIKEQAKVQEKKPDPEEKEEVSEKAEDEEEKGEEDEEEELTIEIEQLFPPLDELYEFDELKERKVTSILEFLLETTHPSSPVDEEVLAPILIPTFIENLERLMEEDERYGEIKVNISSQDWIDGYLRNAFKRRDIVTVYDVTKFKLDDLLEVGELQRTLFYGLIDTLTQGTGGGIDPMAYNGEHAEEKIKVLNDIGIDSLEKLAATPSIELIEEDGIWDYLDLIITESKDKFIQFLTDKNSMGNLKNLKEISDEIEKEMDRLGITDIMDLLILPIEDFSDSLQDRIVAAKREVGKDFEGFYKKHQSAFEDANITILEELVYNPDYYLSKDLSKTSTEDLFEAVEYLMLPSILASPHLIPYADILYDAGVNTYGKFLIWPKEELLHIIDSPYEWMELIRENAHVQELKQAIKDYLPELSQIKQIFEEDELEYLEELQIETIPEATYIRWGDVIPTSIERWTKIYEVNNILLSPLENVLDYVTDKEKYISQAIEDLKDDGIFKILQFVRLPTSSITQRISTKRKREAIEQLSTDLKLSNPEYINAGNELHRVGRIFHAIERLKLPLVFLSEFRVREVALLNDNDIQTIHQLLTMDKSEVAEILEISTSEFEKKIEESTLRKQGTPLSIADERGNRHSIITFEREGNEYFQQEEINALASSGFNTVESLYYNSDHRTFDVHGVSWEIVRHFKKLMQSPPVLITWKNIIKEEVKSEEEQHISESALFTTPEAQKEEKQEEDKDEDEEDEEEEVEYREVEYFETFTSEELEALTDANIRRVLDFLTTPTEEIAEIVGWEKELTEKRQTTIILQEAGIELRDLDIFREDHIEHLQELSLVTIEDLYFTAKKETWESSIIPWKPIQTIKDILHLHLVNAAEELGDDIVELLNDNDIETILEFILTGDPILEQETGLPAERFENLKYALDFGALIEAFDKTVLFTPGLTYTQTLDLMDAGYQTILDLVLDETKNVAEVLDFSEKETKLLLDKINRSDIQQCEDERGVLIKDLDAFSRSDYRSIARSAIFEMNEMDTLQEVLYQITPETFQGENYLLEQVISLQKVATLELNKIGDLNEEDVELLYDHDITTIADVVLIGYEDINADLEVDKAMTRVTKSVTDMRPFIAMGKIPASAAMLEEGLEEPLLDAWINHPDQLHDRTMRNIRSILSLPVRLTSLAKLVSGSAEDLGKTTIADILMEYIPNEDDPHFIIQEKLHEVGSLVRLLDEGSTPLTLLELEAPEFRGLAEHGIHTIERAMMLDVKELSKISGTTQKYWKETKDLFDPEVFNARLEDIGIPISVLQLDDTAELEKRDVEYLDQVTVFGEPEGLIEEIQDFLFSTLIFAAGTPGERELAENHGAQTIIDGVMALKKHGANPEVINELVILAWQSYEKNKIPLPGRFCTSEIKTVQNMTANYLRDNDSVGKKTSEYIEQFVYSPLLLNLPNNELRSIANEHRCRYVIDALSSPMVSGEIDDLRENLKDGEEEVGIIEDIELPNSILIEISKTIWKRIEKSNLSLQEVLTSPRTLNKYRDTKQKYLQQARQAMKLPLSRIHLNGDQLLANIGDSGKYLRLEDIIYDLPSIYQNSKEQAESIIERLGREELEVISELELEEELLKAGETAFGIDVEGFYELWVSTWNGVQILNKIDTKPSDLLSSFVTSAMAGVDRIKEIKPIEIWNLWKHNIYTISDILLVPRDDLGATDEFTKKRVSQLKSLSLESLDGELAETQLGLTKIASYFDVKINNTDLSFLSLFHSAPHPLMADDIKNANEKIQDKLTQPVMISEFAEGISQEQVEQILSAGIYNFADFILYPPELPGIPEEYKEIDDRLQNIVGKYSKTRENPSISEYQFPDIITGTFDGNTSLSRLIYEIINSDDIELSKSVSLRLDYSELDDDIVESLKQENIISVMDLLITHTNELTEILQLEVSEIEDLRISIDIKGMYDSITKAPLQVQNIESISQGGRDLLRELNIYTALDLKLPLPDGFNRIDTSYLTTIYHILSSDPSLLLTADGFERDDLDQIYKSDYETVREVIRQRDEFDKQLKSTLSNLSTDSMVKIKDEHRDLHDYEDIIIKDEKNLLKAGYFTFVQVSKQSADDLVEAGIDSNKAGDIIEVLQSHWRNIIGLSEEIETEIEELGLSTVAEVLTAPEFTDDKLSTPIKVRKELKFDQLFDEVPSVIVENSITSVSEFIKSKEMQKLYKESNEEVMDVVSILQSWVGKTPEIKSNWISKLEDAGIDRIWEFIVEDANALASITGSSIKSQEEFKEEISLVEYSKDTEFIIPTATNEDADLLQKYGFYSIRDVKLSGLLDQFISQVDKLDTLITNYREYLNSDFTQLDAFWQIEPNNRRKLVINARTIDELSELDFELASEFVSEIKSENFREFSPLDRWITDTDELESLGEKSIESVEEWMVANARGEIESGSKSFKLFRSTLDIIPYFTIKHIVSGYHNGITHISDMVLENNKDLAKKLRTTSRKVEELLEKVPEIPDERPKLPDIGLVSSSIVDSLREGGIYSWAQLLGNAVKEEIETIKGVTWNTVESLRENADAPISHSEELRKLGVSDLQKLTDDGVSSIADILIIGQKFKDFIGDEERYFEIMNEISRANLNKGEEAISLRLSESYKIRVKDIPKYEEAGIMSPIDVLIGNYPEPDDEELQDGIDDWKRLGELDVEEINFPIEVIENLKEMGLTKMKDAIVAPDGVLRDAGATTHKIKKFRKDLNRLSSGDERVQS